jgi:uridylate kinase
MNQAKDDKPVYRRILLKLSGEALQGDQLFGIDTVKLTRVATEIKSILEIGVEVAIVIGGGNLIRGSDFYTVGIDRVTSDQMGMLATIINGLALRDAFDKKALPVKIMSAIAVPGLVDFYNRRAACEALQQGQTVIFVGGTGNPLVTTDSAAALRGVEVEADIILKATKVDGVFASDPIKNPKAERYDTLTYDEVIEQRLGVMDLNAVLLCRDNGIPLRVFNMNKQGALLKIMGGETIGTLIKGGEKP